jgi:transmembrane sensor
MNSSTYESVEPNRRRIRAEAAAWIAKLHGPDRSVELEAGLRRWLAEHPLHAEEFELATDVWSDSADLKGGRLPFAADQVRRPARNAVFRPLFAVVAVCALLVGFAVYLWRDPAITTGVNEQKTVTLADGTRVTLNTDSRLVLQYDKGTRTVVLTSGEAYFNVAHDASRPFVVRAGDRKVIAIGTSFMVRRNSARNDVLTVTLIEGRVAVVPLQTANTLSPEPAPEVTVLRPGERLRAQGHKRQTVETASIDQATGWMRGQLMFDDTPLREAVEEFNRYQSVKIQLPPGGMDEIRVGGVFRIGDAISFARAVAESHDLKLTVDADQVFLEPATKESSEPAR